MADEEQFTAESVSKMKVTDLKRELKLRGLNPNGNKVELVERLMQAMQQNKTDDGSADSVDDLIDEDEVLNDEEIDDEVADYKNLELEVSDKSFEMDSTNAKSLKRKSSEISRSESVESVTKAKKITLNRHLSSDTEPQSTPTAPSDTANGKDEDEKKVIKLSELSAKERLEMRAKKFGAPLSFEAKKMVRAERFGQETTATATATPTATSTSGKKNVITFNSSSDIERLKKRAERFGSTVSSELTKVEKQEKLEQRKARFGGVTTVVTASATPATATATATNGSNTDSQKSKRLERFKTTLK